MHDVACEFARAAVRSKDAQKQLARTSLHIVDTYANRSAHALRAKCFCSEGGSKEFFVAGARAIYTKMHTSAE